MWRWLRARSPRQVLLAGYVVFLLYGFPGYMSTDSVQQLVEARTGHTSDGHPPIMAKEWSLLDAIVSGPLLMLMLQGALMLGALYVLMQRVLPRQRAAWVACAILLFPPVLAPMAVIWKDSQMATYLVAGVAALVQPRLRTRLVGLALLVVACALRHNAFAAVVPIVFFVFEWRTGLRWWKRVTALVVIAVVTVATALALTRVLAVEHVKMTPALHDIAGVLAEIEPRTDDDLRYVLRGTPLRPQHDIQWHARVLFKQGSAWRIAGGEDRLFDVPTTDAQWDAVSRAWNELVLGNPGAYLAAHWDRFQDLTGLAPEPPRANVWNIFLEDFPQSELIDHAASPSDFQQVTGAIFQWLAADTPLFRPWIYIAIALALLVLCCRDRLTAGLLVSGLLYEASFFPVGVDPDYRYSHWLILCTVVATVTLYIQRARRPP